MSTPDFGIGQGQNGKILKNKIPGFSLILFYSVACKFCKTLTPIFKQLPGRIAGVQFGLMNVKNNMRCVQISQKTKTPIVHVPYMVFYVNGTPYMEYKGPHTKESIISFIVDVTTNLRNKTNKHKQEVKNDPKRGGLQTYGNPLYGDSKVCYLEFEEAYQEKIKKK